jgi:hypothetical protein
MTLIQGKEPKYPRRVTVGRETYEALKNLENDECNTYDKMIRRLIEVYNENQHKTETETERQVVPE